MKKELYCVHYNNDCHIGMHVSIKTADIPEKWILFEGTCHQCDIYLQDYREYYRDTDW